MPVRTSPSPMTNSAAISSTLGSLNPATASCTVSTPLNGSATITSSATTSMRGLLRINSIMLASSRARVISSWVFIGPFRIACEAEQRIQEAASDCRLGLLEVLQHFSGPQCADHAYRYERKAPDNVDNGTRFDLACKNQQHAKNIKSQKSGKNY